MKNSLLSVVIPTYQRDVQILNRAVSSIFNQEYHPIEIIVVDDNFNGSKLSKDVNDYCSKKGVRYIKQDGNKGGAAARNLGAYFSKGEYLGFLDDDDAWKFDKAGSQIKMFNKETGLVYCKGIEINDNFSPPKETVYYNAWTFKSKLTFNDMLEMDYIGSTSQVIMKKSCFDKCGGFNENLLARQDWEMWIRISRDFDIVGVDDYLFYYHVHSGSQITKSSLRSLQGYSEIYKLYKYEYNDNLKGTVNIHKKIILSAMQCGKYFTVVENSFQLLLDIMKFFVLSSNTVK